MNRKGIYFSIIAMLLAGFAIATFLAYNTYTYSDQMGIIEVRISSMDDFLEGVETDLGRALYISSYRALISLNEYITDTNKSKGRLLENVTNSFDQIMRNGTIGSSAAPELLMQGQTMADWIGKIEAIGLQVGINTSLEMTEVGIRHKAPFIVSIDANFTIMLDDTAGLAHWEREVSMTADVNIIDFRDPLYANRTHGEYRRIAESEITSWNVSNLRLLLESGEYVAKPSSPTFLMRMEGRFNGDPNGILTLIDEKHLFSQENRSMVDFVYWGLKKNDSQKIQGISDLGYPSFALDKDHIVFFGVMGLNYTGP